MASGKFGSENAENIDALALVASQTSMREANGKRADFQHPLDCQWLSAASSDDSNSPAAGFPPVDFVDGHDIAISAAQKNAG
ncbi:MAG: hypothetical protein ACRECA_05365 [Pseudolabrys sp.]